MIEVTCLSEIMSVGALRILLEPSPQLSRDQHFQERCCDFVTKLAVDMTYGGLKNGDLALR